MTAHQEDNKRTWLGIILVAGGLALLLNNLDIIPIHIPRYLISWKTFLIGLGVFLIIGKKKTGAGLILITIGGAFLLQQDLHLFHMRNIWEVLVPAIIIMAGASLVLRKTNTTDNDEKKKNRLDNINDLTLLGGRKRTIDSQNFQGGSITVLFGGSEINLSKAQLAPETNTLDIMVLFGGCEIIVPDDWTIKTEVTSLLGAFEDQRNSSLKVVPNEDKVLIVKGMVMFGGGEIRFPRV